ncbi:MAG: cation-translocating P-type ATPase [Sporomusaceae bacterium]|nr:cation-translocating P-type ATPase [Sporomusaceae bacterium]
MEKAFVIEGLDCADCAAHLGELVGKIPGVALAKVNFTASKLQVIYDENRVTVAAIDKVVRTMGYQMIDSQTVRPNEKATTSWFKNRKFFIVAASGIALLLANLLEGLGQISLAEAFYLGTMVIGGYPVAKSGLYSLRQRSLDTNFLMLLAAIGAVAIGQWSEGATVVFLFSLGNLLQAYTLYKTRSSVNALLDLTPAEALVQRDGQEIRLPVEVIEIGDRVLVKPGERIALDGHILSGATSVNQAPITGESLPVDKTIGDTVYAGTINGEGAFAMTVTQLASESTVAKIQQRVEAAQAQKAPIQQIVDRFAAYYTPVVIAGAGLMMTVPPLVFSEPFQPWFYRALVLLVISCPCALVISTPVSIVAALGNASRHGILVKGGNYLEAAGMVKSIAFDKTGTLTTGKLTVTDVLPIDNTKTAELLQVAAALERWSEHPIAKAIMVEAKRLNTLETALEAKDFQALPGRGARAELADGTLLYGGNRRLFMERNLPLTIASEAATALEEMGKTVVYFGSDKEFYGVIALADQVREQSKATVASLQSLGIDSITMLTGDNRLVAKTVADSLGLQQYYSELLPEDKVTALNSIIAQQGQTLMVGDGINDAPALATAQIGVAMGAAGSDAAIEVADIALLSDDLSKLPYLIRLSRQTMAIIKQNIVFSIGLKGLFVVGTFFGIVNLWLAIFADMGASLLVTLNGMRLLREQKSRLS